MIPASVEDVKDEGFKKLILQLLGAPESRPSANELLSHPFLLSVSFLN